MGRRKFEYTKYMCLSYVILLGYQIDFATTHFISWRRKWEILGALLRIAVGHTEQNIKRTGKKRSCSYKVEELMVSKLVKKPPKWFVRRKYDGGKLNN